MALLVLLFIYAHTHAPNIYDKALDPLYRIFSFFVDLYKPAILTDMGIVREREES